MLPPATPPALVSSCAIPASVCKPENSAVTRTRSSPATPYASPTGLRWPSRRVDARNPADGTARPRNSGARPGLHTSEYRASARDGRTEWSQGRPGSTPWCGVSLELCEEPPDLCFGPGDDAAFVGGAVDRAGYVAAVEIMSRLLRRRSRECPVSRLCARRGQAAAVPPRSPPGTAPRPPPPGRRTLRTVVRDPSGDRARSLSAAGVETVRGDLRDPESLRAAFSGAHGVFSVQPNSGQAGADGTNEDEVRFGAAVAEIAGRCGVAHLVYSSAVTAGSARGVDHPDTESRIEAHVRNRDTRQPRHSAGHVHGTPGDPRHGPRPGTPVLPAALRPLAGALARASSTRRCGLRAADRGRRRRGGAGRGRFHPAPLFRAALTSCGRPPSPRPRPASPALRERRLPWSPGPGGPC